MFPGAGYGMAGRVRAFASRGAHCERGSSLPDLVRKRLNWEIWSEYSHNCRIGRSLEKTGAHRTVQPGQEVFDAAAKAIHLRLQNEVGGLRAARAGTDARVPSRFLTNLKNRGGVWQPELLPYVQRLGDAYVLTNLGDRERYMPRPELPVRGLPEFLILYGGNGRFLPADLGKREHAELAHGVAAALVQSLRPKHYSAHPGDLPLRVGRAMPRQVDGGGAKHQWRASVGESRGTCWR